MATGRQLGKSGLEVSPIMLGGNVFGWTADEATSFRVLDAFVDAGFNFVDTADVYSHWVPGNRGGESEEILGRWFARSGKRDSVILATKVGKPMGEGKKGLSRKYIFAAVEDSLKRLQTDRIDLYQSHEDDPNTPLEETMGAFAELIQQGKVRAIGASNFSAARLEDSLEASAKNGWPRYESLQPHYNLYERTDYETNLEPVCLREELGAIPYFSLASGFLTGKYRSKEEAAQSKRAGMLGKYFDARGMRILAALDAVAREHNSTPAKVALAWLLARPGITAPIASATSVEQLKDLLDAASLRLGPSAIQKLIAASGSAFVAAHV